MYKITITGIDGYLLAAVEDVGKIEYLDQCRHIFTASFDGCNVKIKGDIVKIRNVKNRSVLILANNEFEEISIK